jgi:hypothetical protein
MADISIAESEGKFGLRVEGRVDSGRREQVSPLEDDRGIGFDIRIDSTDSRWALEPKFDKITNATVPGSLLNFYITVLDSQYGLYYINNYNTEHTEFIKIDFSHKYLEVPYEKITRGGFIIAPQPDPIILKPDEKKYLFEVTVGAKHGILSGRSYWARKPVYDDIARLSEDVYLLRKEGTCELASIARLWDTEANLSRDIIVIAGPGNWSDVKAALVSRGLGDQEIVEQIGRKATDASSRAGERIRNPAVASGEPAPKISFWRRLSQAKS